MDTPKQTFSALLQSTPACDKIKPNNGWMKCPRCGRGKVLKLLPTTTASDLVVYCKICNRESIVNIPSVPVP